MLNRGGVQSCLKPSSNVQSTDYMYSHIYIDTRHSEDSKYMSFVRNRCNLVWDGLYTKKLKFYKFCKNNIRMISIIGMSLEMHIYHLTSQIAYLLSVQALFIYFSFFSLNI